MATDLDEFDEDFEDLAETLGLPDHLPPLRLPPEEDLVAAARRSAVLARVRTLATWVGERRAVTEDGDLTTEDTAAAAELLGIPVTGTPEMAQVPELVLLWDLAAAVDLVVVSGDVVDANLDLWPTDVVGEDLATWSVVLSGLLDSVALDADLAGEENLDLEGAGSFVLLLFLARSAGTPLTELSLVAHETSTEHLDPAEAEPAWTAWVAANGDPATVLLGRLVEHGAVETDDDAAWLTPLGLWALHEQLTEGGIEIPLLPPTEDMTAAELLAALPGMTADERDAETNAWLALRDAPVAATELLTAAADAEPQGRLWATSFVAPSADAWQTVADEPALRAYARVALGADRDATDLAWQLVDAVAATADVLGTYDPAEVVEKVGEVVPAGREDEVLSVAWRLPHQDTFDVLTLIGDHHPDKKVAKASRTSAHKAESAR
jgi:hypothetical protein